MSLNPEFADSHTPAPRKRQRLVLGREENISILGEEFSNRHEEMATSTGPISAKPAPFSDKLGCDIVQLYVGPEKRLFTVHKKLLTAATPVFNTMFDGPFLESAEKSATFPEDSSEAWELLIQYLYTNRLAPLILTPHRNDKLEGDALQSRVGLYCLAEAYAITPLQDLAIDSLAQTYRVRMRMPLVATFRYAYLNTSEKSPLRALMAKWFYHILVTREDGRGTRYPTDGMSSIATEVPDLLDDVFSLMRGQQAHVPRDIMDPSEVHPCTYHQHHINSPDPRPLPLLSMYYTPSGGMDYSPMLCPNASEVSWEAEKLLKIMKETFPNGRKRSTVESLTRRLGIDRKQAMVLVEELINARKVTWTVSEKLPGENLLECC